MELKAARRLGVVGLGIGGLAPGGVVHEERAPSTLRHTTEWDELPLARAAGGRAGIERFDALALPIRPQMEVSGQGHRAS
jgi:hypothetical protein